MSSANNNGKDENDDIPPPQKPPSPPPHTTFTTRGIHAPNFAAFKPRDIRLTSPYGMNHVAWNCDGQRLAAVGIDRNVRIWWPEKSMEVRSASLFSAGHNDAEVDYVSWNPAHPDLFCTSSQKDRKIVFWDARITRPVQQVNLKYSPATTSYSPDGRSLVYTTTGRVTNYLLLDKASEDAKEQWSTSTHQGVRMIPGSTATWNHVGDGLVLTNVGDTSIRVVEYPGLSLIMHSPAHVGGCMAAALDPRGKYLASGGNDGIVNMFDLTDWICARTITVCDNAINHLSFSFDGEYLAISNAGSYIDICATETGMPLHRIPALGPSATVQWHPSKHVIAYCGQTQIREGGPPPSAWLSLFGPGI
ncbi:WD40 repeat-like protein [Cristinia sonorae]|uniref:WD40 repeat-like protein n=1 Tax=Cristinia sonorae TaxID=1940300 RepID=A0A8K0XN40_9AGAR|nr:WD40 repeat-like protein [Cristinia sonorae]